MLQVIAACAMQPQTVSVALAAFFGHFDGLFAIQVLRGKRMRPQHLLRRTGKHHFTSQTSRLGTHVYHVIGRQHHVAVMLYHNHRIAYVTQLLQRMNQALVVPLVQTNARLVQYVKYVH